MATVNKDFKIKSGLIVEGTTGTINGEDILTTSQASTDHIVSIVGGTTLVTSVSGNLAVTNGDLAINESGLATDLAGSRLYTDGASLNVDGEGLFDDFVANGMATGTDISTAISSLNLATTYDAYGAAGTAETNAKSYADSLASNYDAAGAASSAQTAAQGYADSLATNYDAAGSASTAETNAKGYADGLASNYDAAGAASTAQSNANSYTDGEITTALSTAQGYADQAESNANAYTDNAVAGLAWKTAVNLKADFNIAVADSVAGIAIDGHGALSNASAGYRLLLTDQTTATENGIWEVFIDGGLYIRRAVDADTNDELIGAAVYVMEGTNYGSTSWVQANHYITAYAGQNWTQFSGQGSVIAGTGITVDGLTVSVNRTTVDTWYDAAGDAASAEAAANSYTDGEITTALTTAQGYATTAETNANGYADSLATNYDASGAASTAQSNANSYTDTAITNLNLGTTYDAYGAAATAEQNAKDYADALTTDDVAEGTNNLYLTEARVNDFLTTSTQTNISITEDVNGHLVFVAENGVADSTTTDLAEGTNLYFTAQRVLDAIDTVTITPAAVEINNFRKEEATQQSVSAASTVNVHSFAYPYESVKYLVRVVGWDGGVKHSQITEILMTVDGNNNIAITEYGNVHTSTSPLASFSAAYNSGDYTLTATTSVAGCEIIAAATMLSWVD